jgi:hypothetical protein
MICEVAFALSSVRENGTGLFGHRFKLDQIMCAEDADGVSVVSGERSHAALVGHTRLGIDLHESLIATQPWGAGTARAVDLAVVEIGVACVKEPATVILLDGDAGMPPGMAGEWDQQDLGRQTLQLTDGIEPEPSLAPAEWIERPVGGLVPLLRAIAFPRDERTAATLVGDFFLSRSNVNARVRKIFDPAGMIEVEMRHDDVADVSRRKAQAAYLRDRGLFPPELRSVERQEKVRQPLPRSRYVLVAIAGIH